MKILKQVIVIPPSISESSTEQVQNVAAYCRVSTPAEIQQHSLEAQIQYYGKLIDDNPLWTAQGVYSDAGSGRSIVHRKGLQSLLRKCRRGTIDLILIKSISRLGRNSKEISRILTEWKERGIDVWFETEDIHLKDDGTWAVINLYLTVAEQESRTKSEMIQWGLRSHYISGNGGVGYRPCYGYQLDHSRNIIIHQEEAMIVRLLFLLYLDGKSLRRISDVLYELGICSPKGNDRWNPTTIMKILSNERYTGDVLLGKRYSSAGRVIRNYGEKDQYLLEGHHQAIVGTDVFRTVQRLLHRHEHQVTSV